MALIDMRSPHRTERRRSFQPPWYTVFVYTCQACHKETTVRASSFIGSRPVPAPGAIYCPHCEFAMFDNVSI